MAKRGKLAGSRRPGRATTHHDGFEALGVSIPSSLGEQHISPGTQLAGQDSLLRVARPGMSGVQLETACKLYAGWTGQQGSPGDGKWASGMPGRSHGMEE